MGEAAERLQIRAEAGRVAHRSNGQHASSRIEQLGHRSGRHTLICAHWNQAYLHSTLLQSEPGKRVVPVLTGRHDHVVARLKSKALSNQSDAHAGAGDQGILIGSAAEKLRQELANGAALNGTMIGLIRS